MQLTRRPLTGENSVPSKIWLFFTTALLLTIMAGSLLHAQQSDGTITGLVVDSSNGAIAGAKVVVSSNDGQLLEALISALGRAAHGKPLD